MNPFIIVDPPIVRNLAANQAERLTLWEPTAAVNAFSVPGSGKIWSLLCNVQLSRALVGVRDFPYLDGQIGQDIAGLGELSSHGN